VVRRLEPWGGDTLLEPVDTCISHLIHAAPLAVYERAAAVEDWPRFLPHYRWVRVLARSGPYQRTVEMAARRDILGSLSIPLWWTAVQTLHPETRRIDFEHIRGITRGMQVVWRIEANNNEPEGTLVQIQHVFEPRWPLPDVMTQAIIGDYFVNAVARRTLTYLGEQFQRPS
jgi:ribosome-associated toxin RatA of RatAB toxin-antitoxin module